jgi:PAS domain S-box-containing protein
MLESVVILILPTHLLYIGFMALFALAALVFILLYVKLSRKVSTSRISSVLKEKHLLEQLFNNIPDRIYFKDRESRFILANKHVSQIMGESDPDKLIGRTDFDFYDEKYARGYYEDEQQIMKEGKPLIAKAEKGIDLEGNEIDVSTTKIPIKDSSGKVIGLIGIGRDISKQKRAEGELIAQTENLREINALLEEKQEEIQQMAEELNAQADHLRKANKEMEMLSLVASKTENVVVIMDANANFQWVNKGFEDLYKYTLDEFVSRYGRNLRENSSHPNISAILNQIYITKRPFTYNATRTNEEGTVSWSQTNISPIVNSDDEIDKLILIDSDITELKNAEERIRKQKEEIEEQTEILRNLNATKDRLFSIIAHDLRNPFHSILGFADLMTKKIGTDEPEQLKQYLEMMKFSTHSAYQLLENLLEWARAQTNQVVFSPESIPLREFIEEVVQLQAIHASNKRIEMKMEVGKEATAFADRNMLNTVLRNLISNAIKFTKEEGKVKIEAHKDKDLMHIRISDTGIGIPEEKLKTLFDLEAVNSTAGTSGETGTGLGLQVCYEFMKMNQGTIQVSSTPGKGSTFQLTLQARE